MRSSSPAAKPRAAAVNVAAVTSSVSAVSPPVLL
jgi:hypothetical protein